MPLRAAAWLSLVWCGALAHEPFHTPAPNGTWSFLETFDEPFVGRWTVSAASGYEGTWGEPSEDSARSRDRGLLVLDEARKSAISIDFEEPFQFEEGLPLVVQYEVKLQMGLQCGGAYIKLLSKAGVDVDPFDNSAPYVIMFGPDRCGSTDRVHFILKYRNPVSGDVLETAANLPPVVPNDLRTHVYTLVLYSNDTFEMFIDLDSRLSGSLLEDMEPPINPPPTIDDPTDEKPADWVDLAQIPDPDAVKPEDWDETAPQMIPDPEAQKPDDWDEAIPREVPDPEAKAPSNWDPEEDGEWEAPMVPNPKCPKQWHCGPWSRPTIPNPAYKGAWRPPLIPNPAYRGPWKPRQLPNPAYFEEKHPVAHIEPIYGLGIEIWSMQRGMLFDNFLLSHDLEAALDFARATWGPKQQLEDVPPQASPLGEFVQSHPVLCWGAFALVVFVVPLLLLYFCTPSPTQGAPGEDESTDEHSTTEQDEQDEGRKEVGTKTQTLNKDQPAESGENGKEEGNAVAERELQGTEEGQEEAADTKDEATADADEPREADGARVAEGDAAEAQDKGPLPEGLRHRVPHQAEQ